MQTKKSQKHHEELNMKSAWLDVALERRITQNYKPLMSNAKWRKLLKSLTNSPIPITKVRWQIFDKQQDYSEESDWADIDEWNEVAVCLIYDYFWVLFKNLEWIDVLTKDPNGLYSFLSNVAKFELERVEEGIRIYGYRKIQKVASQ
jgi:hypothetical protein